MQQITTYGLAFALGTIKFLIAASIVSTSELSPFEIAIATGLGALTSFNIFYWSAGYFMWKSKEKKRIAMQNGTYKPNPTFTRINKFMVKTKMSKSGFWLICILAPLFLSVPIGSIIVAKFYNDKKITYPLVTVSLIALAFILAYLNDYIFSLFDM